MRCHPSIIHCGLHLVWLRLLFVHSSSAAHISEIAKTKIAPPSLFRHRDPHELDNLLGRSRWAGFVPPDGAFIKSVQKKVKKGKKKDKRPADWKTHPTYCIDNPWRCPDAGVGAVLPRLGGNLNATLAPLVHRLDAMLAGVAHCIGDACGNPLAALTAAFASPAPAAGVVSPGLVPTQEALQAVKKAGGAAITPPGALTSFLEAMDPAWDKFFAALPKLTFVK